MFSFNVTDGPASVDLSLFIGVLHTVIPLEILILSPIVALVVSIVTPLHE